MTKATEQAINEKVNAANTTTLERELLKFYMAAIEAKKGK